MSSEPEKIPDVEAIMERIRAEVKQAVKDDRANYPRYVPTAEENRPGKTLIEAEELSYLNQHWHDWSVPEEIVTHRKFVGKFIVRAKRFVVDTVWHYLLKGYLDREKQYQMQLVRFLNATAKHTDQRDYEIFWQLIKKMDSDVEALNERMDRLFGQLQSHLLALESEQERKAVNGRG